MIADVVAKAGPRALTPDVPKEERLILARNQTFTEAAKVEARKRYVAMHQRQVLIAQDLQRMEHKAVNGLGTHQARIDGELYMQMRALYGDDCWSDDDFIEAFLRDNEYARVKVTRGTRGQEYAGRGR